MDRFDVLSFARALSQTLNFWWTEGSCVLLSFCETGCALDVFGQMIGWE